MKNIIPTLLFIIVIQLNAQNNSYPLDGNIKLYGDQMELYQPVTTGGWAKGLLFFDENQSKDAGIGILGTAESTDLLYMAHGASPWDSNLGLYIKSNGYVGIGTYSPKEKLQIADAFTFHDGGHKVIGFLHSPSGAVDLNSSKYAAEIRFDPTLGDLRLATSSSIDSAPITRLNINKNGNVGIGTTNPAHKLDINTGSGNFKSYQYGTEFTVNTTGGWARSMRFRNENNNATASFGSQNGTAFISTNFDINVDPIGYQNQKLTVLTNGNVGIGTTTPDTKLAVNGTIHTQEVKVDLIGWPDFVFYNDYKLPTLLEVENHIKEKGHLKDIPSAKDVEENGVFLGEMNSKLLQKMEELTLYTIQQDKELKASKESNTKLEARLSRLEAIVNDLEKN